MRRKVRNLPKQKTFRITKPISVSRVLSQSNDLSYQRVLVTNCVMRNRNSKIMLIRNEKTNRTNEEENTFPVSEVQPVVIKI